MENDRIPGELEAVVVRMPLRVGHNVFVNRHIANSVKKAAHAYKKLGSDKLKPRKQKKYLYNVQRTEALIDRYEPVTVVDAVMSHLVSMKVDRVLLADFAKKLLSDEKSPQCKKTGIAFLGTFGKADSVQMVKPLGFDEEYTFFVVKALKRLESDIDTFILDCTEIAGETTGWGKIAAILELPDNIENEEIRKFLLAAGTSNSIGKYHLAVECAIKGQLFNYLENCSANGISLGRDMSEGICDIFRGLMEGESVKDADSFAEIENIDKIVKDFCVLFERGAVECPNATEVYNYLKDRK